MSLTLDLHLVGCASRAGQKGELFRLVHGVVGTGHHHPIPRSPALWLVSQLQDAAVGQHVDRNEGLWTNYSGRRCELEQSLHTYWYIHTLHSETQQQ